MAGSGAWINAQALFAMQMAKVLADPLRIKILEELNMRELSPSQFFHEFGGGSLSRVWRHFRVLEKHEWIEEVEVKSGGRRRGATEHFFRAIRPPVFYDDTWAPLPESAKEKFSTAIFQTVVGHLKQAMDARTFDAREDRHFTLTTILVDQRGWNQVVGGTDKLFERLFKEQEASESRLAKSQEEPIRTTVILACFESPKDTTKAP